MSNSAIVLKLQRDNEVLEKSLKVACDALEKLISEHKELKIQIQAAIMSGETDKDGFITAYHFKTGAIHRLLKIAREG